VHLGLAESGLFPLFVFHPLPQPAFSSLFLVPAPERRGCQAVSEVALQKEHEERLSCLKTSLFFTIVPTGLNNRWSLAHELCLPDKKICGYEMFLAIEKDSWEYLG